MRVDKEDIFAILLIPVIGVFLLGFYIVIGLVMLGTLIVSGIIYLYEVFTRIDFGFDKDYGIKNTRIKK
jgi:hypothetical protein